MGYCTENIFISLNDGPYPCTLDSILTESMVDNQWAWHPIKPGLALLLLDLGSYGYQACRINLSTPCMIFAFPFSSQATQSSQAGIIPGGACCVSKMSDHVQLEFPSEAAHPHLAVLVMQRKACLDMCADVFEQLPLPLLDALEGREDDYSFSRPMDAATWVVLNQLFLSPCTRFGRRLRREKTALQLIAREIELLLQPGTKRSTLHLHLTADDQGRLRKARSILMANMDTRQDIKTLARQVGMNDYKFKKGFKKIFGEPPMTFLRRHRMARARNLLMHKGLPVTHVALEVGYANPSAFTACFIKYYGCPPSRLLKHQR